jgi:trehalose synthase
VGNDRRVAVLTSVPIGALAFDRFEGILPADRYTQLLEAADRGRELFADRKIWNVNSTARGGGVAEMLISLLAYSRGVGIDARWEVIKGNDPFFCLTKRIHNNLHGSPGDGGELGDAEREIYEEALRPNAEQFDDMVGPQDVVILHDPQTAGLIPALRDNGAPIIWRCHVGIDFATDLSRKAWKFLLPYVQQADAVVFSRRQHVWEDIEDSKINLIAPSIDAFSAKNQELSAEAVDAILSVAGLGSDGADGDPAYVREDGSPARVQRQAQLWEEQPLQPGQPMVLQVSRWDRLKDPLGVMRGFVEHVMPETDAHLVYAGPAVEAVADDPEGKEVLEEAQEYFAGLPTDARARMHLTALPMEDLSENAAIVNALQRRADVVVQKSLAEGFGLTVAEGMWKGRPVVASKIGGIQDQIVNGESGLLVNDPTNLGEYGSDVRQLLQDKPGAERMGREAQERVRDEFLGIRSLMQYLELISRLLEQKR